MNTDLPVFATVGAGYRFLWNHKKQLWPYLAGLLVVVAAIFLVAVLSGTGMLLLGKFMGAGFHSMGKLLVVGLVALVLLVLFLVFLPVSNSLIRLVAVGEGARFGFGYGREEWLVIKAVFLVSGAFLLAFAALFIPSALLIHFFGPALNNQVWMAVAAAAAMIPMMFIGIRLVVYVPSAAVGAPLSLKQAFLLTKGNFWRILFVFWWVRLPFSALDKIFERFVKEGSLSILFLSIAVTLIGLMLQIVVTGFIYRHFLQRPEATVPEEESGHDLATEPLAPLG